MKPSQATLDSLADMTQVRTHGDVRRIIGQSLLALARKEISATDVEAMAKGVSAVTDSLAAEVRLAKTRAELRAAGADLGKQLELGAQTLGVDPVSS